MVSDCYHVYVTNHKEYKIRDIFSKTFNHLIITIYFNLKQNLDFTNICITYYSKR